MPDYRYKDERQLAYDAFKVRLRTEGRIALAGVLNEALRIGTEQFNKAIEDGEVIDLYASPHEIQALLLDSAKKELTAGV